MVIKVYISGNSGNKEIVTHQQRIFMILNSLGIENAPVDIAGPGMEEARDYMRANGKKKDGERNVLPPQIFNEEKYCGDYDDFDIANEDDLLEDFLGLPKKQPLGDPVASGATDEDASKLPKEDESQTTTEGDEESSKEKSEEVPEEPEEPPKETTPPKEPSPVKEPEEVQSPPKEPTPEPPKEEEEPPKDEETGDEESSSSEDLSKSVGIVHPQEIKPVENVEESKKKSSQSREVQEEFSFPKGCTKLQPYSSNAVDAVKKSPGIGSFDESEERSGNCGFNNITNASKFWKTSQLMGTPSCPSNPGKEQLLHDKQRYIINPYGESEEKSFGLWTSTKNTHPSGRKISTQS